MAIFGEETHLALGKMLSVDAGGTEGRRDGHAHSNTLRLFAEG